MDLDLLAESESDSDSDTQSQHENSVAQRSTVTAATAGSDPGIVRMRSANMYNMYIADWRKFV